MKNIYKIIIGIAASCILLVIIDRAVGTLSEKMYYGSKYGIYHRQIYCLHNSKDDVVILGSSRAAHHYVPQVFEDTLGMSCYNAGSDGMCVYYHYVILASRIYRKQPPKTVIYEVLGSDATVSQGAAFTLDAALERLAPHYGDTPVIDSLFSLGGWKENLKLLSKTYKYNSALVQLIKCNYIPWPEDRGYEALKGKMKVKKGVADDVLEESKVVELDSIKIQYIKKLIALCKQNDIKLVMCYSPYYKKPMPEGAKVIKQIAQQENVIFFDYNTDVRFQNEKYYQDASHMNDTGAKLYSKDLVGKIK